MLLFLGNAVSSFNREELTALAYVVGLMCAYVESVNQALNSLITFLQRLV